MKVHCRLSLRLVRSGDNRNSCRVSRSSNEDKSWVPLLPLLSGRKSHCHRQAFVSWCYALFRWSVFVASRLPDMEGASLLLTHHLPQMIWCVEKRNAP